MTKRDDETSALMRLLDSDHLARTVPELAPEVLHHVILRRGLEACTDLVAAATPEQITTIFDLDLWQPTKPGLDDQLDVARFGEWVEALVDRDPSLAARTVAALDAGLAVAAMSRYVRVFDPGTFERVVPTEEFDTDLAPDPFDGLVCELSGYVVRARRNDYWDAIVLLLHALQDDQPARFDEVMRGCRRLSNDRPEEDGFHALLEAPEQFLLDVTLDRDLRREERGYVTPADARAFLDTARRPHKAIEQPRPERLRPQKQTQTQSPRLSPADASGEIIEGGADDSRALIWAGGAASNETRMWRTMRYLGERDAEKFDERMKELAFIAGALVSGCPLGDRPFTPLEAHDAAIAICNLGLEQWPAPGVEAPMPEDFLLTHELVPAFEAGWMLLYEQVSLVVADRLIATLRNLQAHDLDTRRGLIALERELMKHRAAGAPWRVREALDIIAILDMAAWTSLLGLLSECPVLPAALPAILTGDVNRVDPQAFEFIATSDRIRDIHTFMAMLPDVLV